MSGQESDANKLRVVDARELLKANQIAMQRLTDTVNALALRVERLGAIVGELKDRLHVSPCSFLLEHEKEVRKLERSETSKQSVRRWQIMLLVTSASIGGLVSLFIANVTRGLE